MVYWHWINIEPRERHNSTCSFHLVSVPLAFPKPRNLLFSPLQRGWRCWLWRPQVLENLLFEHAIFADKTHRAGAFESIWFSCLRFDMVELKISSPPTAHRVEWIMRHKSSHRSERTPCWLVVSWGNTKWWFQRKHNRHQQACLFGGKCFILVPKLWYQWAHNITKWQPGVWNDPFGCDILW